VNVEGHEDRRGDWSLATVLRLPGYEQRLARVLELVAEQTGMPDCFLYVPDASGRRLRLELSRVTSPTETPTASAHTAAGAAQQEGGAGWSAPSPALELALAAEDAADRVVETAVGRMLAIALLDPDGALVAVVQAGPLRTQTTPRRLAARLGRVRAPLAFVVAEARRAESLRQRLVEASARLEAGQRLAGSALDLDRFTDLLLEMALASTRSGAGFVAIAQERGGELAVRASRGMPAGFERQIELAREGGFFDWSLADAGALALSDLDTASRLGIKTLLAVPLLEAGEPLGIFALLNFGEGGTFDESSLELCAVFAEQIRLMLQSARVFSAFSERYLETVRSLARALDARSRETHRHHERVAELAAAVAAKLGLSEHQIEAVRSAGLIHDVGLAAVGEADAASGSDIAHPALGAGLVEHLPAQHRQLAAAVASHHEWYDGWGFPAGLKGEQIPLEGRILAVAEFVAEMSSETRVRPGWSNEQLAAEIEQRRGVQFDPDVADAALALLRGASSPAQA
jgi:GAF domain-containing protein